MTDQGFDLIAEYKAARGRASEILTGLSEDEQQKEVPACPGWTVRDLASHLTGVSADVVNGNMDLAPGPEWSAAQIETRKDRSMDEVMAEWDEVAPKVEQMMESNPAPFRFLVADVMCHEIDVIGALGRSPERDADYLPGLVRGFVAVAGRKVTEADLPPLKIQAGDSEWLAGKGEAGVTVRAPNEFEVLRAMTGRRTEEQIRSWEWSGDPAPYLEIISVFDKRQEPLEV